MTGDGVKTNPILKRAKAAVREPSTWGTITALVALFAGINPAVVTTVADGVTSAVSGNQPMATVIAAAITGALGILLPERK